MERLTLRLSSFNKALKTLEDVSQEDFSVIVRDAAIQRFEYTFEAMWKTVKIFLAESEGVVCNSPKSCFRELLSLKIIAVEDAEMLLEMTDMRNLTSHTYIEEVAQDIYNRMISGYVSLMKKIFGIIQKSCKD